VIATCWLLYVIALLAPIIAPGQDMTLGPAFAGLARLVRGPVGLAAGLRSSWLRSRRAVLTWLHRTSGIVQIGLGVRLALERRP